MNIRRTNPSRRAASRRGNIIVLSAFLLVVMIAFVALAVDVGYLYVVRGELQRSADAAALAAGWELIDPAGPEDGTSAELLAASARAKAAEYAAYNPMGNQAPALAGDDVEVGYIQDPTDPTSPFIATPAGSMPNAVRVRVQRTSAQNGRAPLFFAHLLGFDSAAVEGQATAALIYTVGGFEVPSDGSNLGILPFALDNDTWDDMLAGGGSDSYMFSSDTVTTGADGIREVNLFPQGVGSPGNRGTVDIGSANNSTANLCQQILAGVSPADMQALFDSGHTLVPDDNGLIFLNGDTGISAGTKDELASIIGEPRMIPLFSSVTGPGNNAEYTIVGWAGVRVMDVNLTGSASSKKVIVQPCNYVTKGGVSSSSSTSRFIYSSVWLVR
jgi:Flp pilus assembly protein TadG